ncbi:TetR/AcrR family transcriptional regulator [Stutzerimonas stutzeri]|uniref:TetR/AcrR family transcriptional regulator n=1 Tax=Stutzerimonas stutzeri TaxID=316 RepID=UPI0015E3EA1A|nr:TetR/AcrR family transcriptional regulator [Stutzerimonas stutzeri]MBA1277814.1 TetR/AcrR family transcriptional regulator [Stutzerimonas stutzeri]
MSTRLPSAKPLKRPIQARAKFTVQAIYDSYVRIWQRDGWSRLTTRAVALEAGVAIGTLYDYFPSKQALHSGYVRYCIEQLLDAIDEHAVKPAAIGWPVRIQRLVRLLAGVEPHLPWFHPDMLELEALVAEPKHQRRVYEDLLGAWHRVIDAATDLPVRPDAATLEALHLSVWGGRRYAMLVQLEPERINEWVGCMEQLCLRAIAGLNGQA